MLSIDRFGDEFLMKFDGGKKKLQTYTGVIMSVLMLVVLIAYSAIKVDILLSKKQVDIISAINEEYFDENLTFSSKQGLNFAFAVRGLNPSLGEIVF